MIILFNKIDKIRFCKRQNFNIICKILIKKNIVAIPLHWYEEIFKTFVICVKLKLEGN